MTQEQIETLLTQLQQQVTLNTASIQQIVDRFNNYVTLNSFQTTSTIQAQVASIQTSIGLVNKISKLIDVNITSSLTKDDLLQWDGDRWTNISPSKIGISGGSGSGTLEGLSDVSISNKSNGQALVWSNSLGKWTNGTVTSSTTGGFDAEAMWEELAKSTAHQINPSHITGTLTLSGLTVNGLTQLKNGTTQLNVNLSSVNVNGNIISTGEMTAYSA